MAKDKKGKEHMIITHEFSLDMVPGGKAPIVWLNQYDSNFELRIKLYASKGIFEIPTGTTAEIRGTKPDKNGYSAACAIDEEHGIVTVTGDQQITAVAGKGQYEIQLTYDGKELNTSNFHINTERASLDLDTVSSESRIREIVEIEEHGTQIIAAAQAIADAIANTVYSDPDNDGNIVISTGSGSIQT